MNVITKYMYTVLSVSAIIFSAGAWFYLLNFVTKLCVISNAFIIAITSQFIDRLMFQYVYDNNETHALLCNSGSVDIPGCMENRTLGFVAWSTSPFRLSTLLTPIDEDTDNTVFPYYELQVLEQYDEEDRATDVS